MSGPSGWPGDDDAETQVLALPAAERQILAALAVVGRATLSADELADLVEVDDVIPLIEDLEQRKLIRRDEKKRYSAIGHVGEQIRKTNAALATGDRVLGYFKTLAAAGALTPERLADDTEAILGISEWAAQNRQWVGLLELVKTLQATFGIAHRVREWLILLGRGRAAAQALGDIHSEIWMLEQLATATAAAGDASSAQRYLREADQLQRGSAPVATRDVRPAQAAAAAGAAGGGTTGVPRVLLWIGGLVLAAVIGAGLGFAIGDDNSPAGSTTTPVPVTITEPGTTLTTEATVTLPASTVVTTETATETTTTLVTTTVVGVP
jgi:hypothetical protein